jgi:DNA-binding response OmpR family regulator
MLTALESGSDYESGYEAGVDDYLTKRLPDIELFSRIHTAYRTLNLRRSLTTRGVRGSRKIAGSIS